MREKGKGDVGIGMLATRRDKREEARGRKREEEAGGRKRERGSEYCRCESATRQESQTRRRGKKAITQEKPTTSRMRQ